MSDYPPLLCVTCRQGTIAEYDPLCCDQCGTVYPRSGGRPVLLRHDNPLFAPHIYRNDGSAPTLDRGKRRIAPDPSVNMAGKRVLNRLHGLLPVADTATVLVVGGGTQRADLDRLLCRDRGVRIIYTDIDVRADVDIFADAHDLPFKDASVDAVVTTAVLEHVMYPERVAAEIARVVKVGGYIYSELPFMQQVHEGAYDFTRYSAVGHQRLLKEFTPIECGLVAGPATTLVWALEHFFLAFAPGRRSRLLTKAVIRWGFGWLKYIDYVIKNRPAALDGASCTYLLGEKTGVVRKDEAIVAAYAGAQNFSHS